LIEAQIKEILEAFGPLKFFKLIMDNETLQSKVFPLRMYLKKRELRYANTPARK
jgi:hypothetical protein